MWCTIVIAALAAGQSAAAPVTFTAPAAWHTRPPASRMRLAEFVIPKAPGDPEDAEAILYYFGGGGGSADANVERWIGQMQQPDGRPSASVARRAIRTINGLKMTTVDVSGTYTAEMRPGATEHFNKPAFRLLGAVIETPQGPCFVKMTGPAKTVARAASDFERLLASIKSP
jgi:hypothetical protein